MFLSVSVMGATQHGRRRLTRHRIRAAASSGEAPSPKEGHGMEIAGGDVKQFLFLETDLGDIRMLLRPDSAPLTVEHVCTLVKTGLYDGCYFYRSDFVLQWGLWLPGPDGEEPERPNPYSDIKANETNFGTFISNRRGTVAVAHGIGMNGNSDLYINLEDNDHLDTQSLGFCVWAQIEEGFSVINALASAVLEGEKPVIQQAFVSRDRGFRPKPSLLQYMMSKSYDSFREDFRFLKPIPDVSVRFKHGEEE